MSRPVRPGHSSPMFAIGTSRRQTLLLAFVLSISLLLALASDWPNAMRFSYTAFEDRGGTLIVQSLWTKRLTPGTDFFYMYGLLPVMVARGWFAVFGASIAAELWLMVCCNLGVAWGLARFASAIRAPRMAVLLLIVVTPLMIRSVYLNVTHALEAALLVNAVAEHARGRPRVSLALVTVCAFVKPSMAYFYGLVLVVLLAVALLRQRGTVADFLRTFGPAIVVCVLLTAYLGFVFGFRALLAIQVPTIGHRTYALMNYGFFHGAGRDFWNPAGANIKYYLGTFIGFWLVSTAILVGGGALAAVRWTQAAFRAAPMDELVLVCLTLHCAFVCLFYGVSWDWINYGFLLVMGVLCMVQRSRAWSAACAVLIAMLLLVHAQTAREKVKRFITMRPSPETANLWASDSERVEWKHVLASTQGKRALIFKVSGCAELLFPNFEGVENWYVLPQLASVLPAPERDRIRKALAQPRIIVVTPELLPILELAPFRQAISGHALSWRGRFFSVYTPSSLLQ